MLSLGDTGDAVIQLQDALVALGYSLVRSGEYDEATQAVVMAYQEWAGIVPATGVYDDATAVAIATAPASAATGDQWPQADYPGAGEWAGPSLGDAASTTSDALAWQRAAHERDYQPQADVVIRPDADHYIVWGFPVGTAELLPQYGPTLDEVAGFLRATDPDATVDIVGHTSTSGANDFNQELSEQRAGAVRDALHARGVPVERMRHWGEGETHLLVSEDQGPEAMARNRRVELTLHRSVVPAAPPPHRPNPRRLRHRRQKTPIFPGRTGGDGSPTTPRSRSPSSPTRRCGHPTTTRRSSIGSAASTTPCRRGSGTGSRST